MVTGGNTPPDIAAQLPPDAQAQLGPATIGFDEDLYFAKLDWEFSDFDRVDLSLKIRDETGDGDQTGTGTAATPVHAVSGWTSGSTRSS